MRAVFVCESVLVAIVCQCGVRSFCAAVSLKSWVVQCCDRCGPHSCCVIEVVGGAVLRSVWSTQLLCRVSRTDVGCLLRAWWCNGVIGELRCHVSCLFLMSVASLDHGCAMLIVICRRGGPSGPARWLPPPGHVVCEACPGRHHAVGAQRGALL